jgi:tRNA N6-adenosine threonylcarbamoyltransferase
VSAASPVVLAVESSCDETAVAVVAGGRRILGQAIASQVALHAPTGGVVPEVAARAHLRWIVPAFDEAMAAAGIGPDRLDAVAVTAGPGLAGSLLVGIAFAKGLAWVHRLPLVGVNHLEGHLYAAWLDPGGETGRREPAFPVVALVVSGGHTFLVAMSDHLEYRLLGETVDDAAGEAFDKAGRLLGLPYPGGPAIARAAAAAGEPPVALPRAWLGDSFDFSFSGLKTALRRMVEGELAALGRPSAEDGGVLPAERVTAIAAGFQASVVDVLAAKTLRAAREAGARTIVLGGGVASNESLRARLSEGAAEAGIDLAIPPPALCTDNGAMIGAAGCRRFLAGERAGLDLDARPSWPLIRPPGAPPTRRPPRRGAAARAYDASRAAGASHPGDGRGAGGTGPVADPTGNVAEAGRR